MPHYRKISQSGAIFQALLRLVDNGYFNASTIFSAVIFIVLFWLASYKLDKDEKKETEAAA